MSDPKVPAVPATSTIETLLANVSAFAQKINSVLTPSATVTTPGGQTLSAIQTFLALAGDAVGTFAPEATIAGFAVSKAIALAGSLAASAPDAIAAVDRVKAAIAGGAAPSPEDWAALDAAADAAHANLQTAVRNFLATHQTG